MGQRESPKHFIINHILMLLPSVCCQVPFLLLTVRGEISNQAVMHTRKLISASLFLQLPETAQLEYSSVNSDLKAEQILTVVVYLQASKAEGIWKTRCPACNEICLAPALRNNSALVAWQESSPCVYTLPCYRTLRNLIAEVWVLGVNLESI